MRHLLIPVLLLGLVAGCSSSGMGPHRIDVQQGNALDQENVARLKPGLNRSQVRFLLGTPLVVDPFRNDRWDYVYVYYAAGKLAEQKRVTLFFEGDTLVRIEGDVPQSAVVAPGGSPSVEPKPEVLPASDSKPEAAPAPAPAPAANEPRAAAPVVQPAAAAPAAPAVVAASPQPPAPVASTAPATPAAAVAEQAGKPVAAEPAAPRGLAESSVVAPLPSPKGAPAYVDPHPRAELSLTPETNVDHVRPDVIPPFPEPGAAPGASADPVVATVSDWAAAWSRRDEEAYLAAYDASFTPQGGGDRAEWEKRRRLLLGVANRIEVKIEAPVVERAADGSAVVTFNQYYRSDTYRDAVVKQMRLVEREGRWLIAEEKVVSALRGSQR